MSEPSRPAAFDRRDALWLAAMVVVGVVVHWSALFVEPLSDDYIQHGMVTGQYPGGYAPWDLFRLFDGAPGVRGELLARGFLPWWSATDLHGTMLRPLPSVTLWADHRIWPRQGLVHHVHSMLWWNVAIVTAGLALRRLFGRPIAWTAVAIFAVDHAASIPLAWHANRAVIIAAALGFAALWLHVRWRQDDPPRGRLVAAVAVFAAFTAGEYGYVAAGYIVAYEWLGRWGEERGPRLRAAAAALAATAIYFSIRAALGYGTVGAEIYASPFATPMGYLQQAWYRLPRLWADLLASVPSATWIFGLRYDVVGEELSRGAELDAIAVHVRIAWMVLAGVALAAWVVRPGVDPGARRHLRWLLVAAVVGTLPVAIAPSDGRLLLPLRLGADAFMASIVVAAWRLGRGIAIASWWRRALAMSVGMGAAWQHGPADVAFAPEVVARTASVGFAHRLMVLGPAAAGVDYQGRDVIVMAAGTQAAMLHGPLVADYHGLPVPRTWHVLSATRSPMFVERTGPRTLVASHVAGQFWLANRYDRSFCPRPRRLPAGTVVQAGVFEATVLAADGRGRPTRVQFEFSRDLEDAHWVWLAPGGLGLQPWTPPPVGGKAFVPLPPDAPASEG